MKCKSALLPAPTGCLGGVLARSVSSPYRPCLHALFVFGCRLAPEGDEL